MSGDAAKDLGECLACGYSSRTGASIWEDDLDLDGFIEDPAAARPDEWEDEPTDPNVVGSSVMESPTLRVDGAQIPVDGEAALTETGDMDDVTLVGSPPSSFDDETTPAPFLGEVDELRRGVSRPPDDEPTDPSHAPPSRPRSAKRGKQS
ncbi:MAG: hypothetical protein QGG40_03970 [Myxococcota bacterium]|nr:hypothetical protein [Myxococcota bacterium]